MGHTQLIRLTDEAPFVLGGVMVTPSARTLAFGAHVSMVEPRVMQVLVTLNRGRGAVVGRETLIDACWDGRLIGEDAVNRAILKLRRALAEIGGGVTVETVAKVGYQLRLPDASLQTIPAGGSERKDRRRRLLAGAAALAALAGVGAFFVGSHQAQQQTRVVLVKQLRVAPDDPAARALAQDFTSDLSRAVLGNDSELEFADARDTVRRTAAFTVAGTVATVGKDLHAVVVVSSDGDPAILWSHDYTAPLADVAGLRQQVSTNLAAVLVCALGTRGLPDQVDRRATALYMEACNLHSGDQRQVAYLLRQVTASAPGFAGAWADLAVSLAFASESATGEDAATMRHEADLAARRALALDPHQGNAFYARALLLPGIRNWVARERIVGAGLKAQPDNPQLYSRRGHDLAAIGRQQECIAANRRAVALDPLFPGKAAGLVDALASAGQLDDANDVLVHMQEAWPDNAYTWHARFVTAARIGNPREAEAMLDDPQDPSFRKGEAAAWRVFLEARASPSKGNVDRAVAALVAQRRRGAATDAQLVMDLALLARPKEALDIALRMPAQSETEFWFRSFLGPLRADPRFMSIARTQGLLQIWRATGMWPDFCNDRSLSYNCRSFARAGGSRG